MDEILARKHSITDKSTIGLLTLNTASIAGVFAALQVGQETLVNLGISTRDIALTICCFLFGSMLALIAVWWDGIQLNYLAGKHIARLAALRKVARTLASPMEERYIQLLREGLNGVEENPPIDFEYSKISIGLQNTSGSLWLAAIGYLIARIVAIHGWH
ncbi:hypothetical protein [Novosphingobium sp.]|uniref:hypothetical protein n=1 Tax=Novosphingobium sp. TaxID=1874826 RepID=UPI00262DB1B6|nr:hypothetical protein [Novosphingobium sp.]